MKRFAESMGAQAAQEIDIDVSRLEDEIRIREMRLGAIASTAAVYVFAGTARAAQHSVRDQDGRFYDAAQWDYGPFSGFALGSPDLARLVVPRLEREVGLDVSDGREYRATTNLLSPPDERDRRYPGLATMSRHGEYDDHANWREYRDLWKEALSGADAELTGKNTDAMVQELIATDGTLDLTELTFSVGALQILNGNAGGNISHAEARIIAQTAIIHEKVTTEGAVTGFMVPRMRTWRTSMYDDLLSETGRIIDEKVLTDSNPFAQQLLELSEGKKGPAQAQIMHVVTGSRAMATSSYWLLKDVYEDPGFLRAIREEDSDYKYDALADAAVVTSPGAMITNRTPDSAIRVNLVRRGERVGQLRAGSAGKVVLSAYLWGQNEEAKIPQDSAVFGFGQRRCPGEHTTRTFLPDYFQHMVENYDLTFPDTSPRGHGFVLSPRPHARVAIAPTPETAAQL